VQCRWRYGFVKVHCYSLELSVVNPLIAVHLLVSMLRPGLGTYAEAVVSRSDLQRECVAVGASQNTCADASSARVQDFGLDMGCMESAVDWLQQWGSTITFGCEVPFPTPLQCDHVARGVRIAFISTAGGRISVLGELYLEVDVPSMEEEQMARVCVTRVALAPEQRLPGEKNVLRALRNALRCDLCVRRMVVRFLVHHACKPGGPS
jgi:hypothetical protein